MAVGLGCQSTRPHFSVSDLEAAAEELGRPLTGDPAALYRLRVAGSGGLRMALLTSGSGGRLTVSDPFGSAVSITAWRDREPPTFSDLREGCRLEAADLSQVLGIGAMPLPQAVLLLAGRLPASADDEISVQEGPWLVIRGSGWSSRVEVARDPWRVVSVQQVDGGTGGWRLDLRDHIGPVPGSVRIRRGDGRWAELELVRLEWNDHPVLPPVPELPNCADAVRQ
jgi:hypothetical protein